MPGRESDRDHPPRLDPGFFLSLIDRDSRDRAGVFLAAGLRCVWQARDHVREPLALLRCRATLSGHAANEIVAYYVERRVPCLDLDEAAFARVVQGSSARGVAGLYRQQWTPLDEADAEAGLCWVVVGRIRAPGNLGTIIRTCDAVGAAGIIFLGPCSDPHDPGCIRGTMGSIFAQRLVRTSYNAFLRWTRENGCHVVGASPDARSPYDRSSHPRPLALLLGDERKGLSPGQKALCHTLVRIPMVGHADSLNVAVAAGILLYHFFRDAPRHRARSGRSPRGT